MGDRKRFSSAATTLALVIAACGGASTQDGVGAEPATTTTTQQAVTTTEPVTPSTTVPAGPELGVVGVSFGGVLTNEDGRTIYVFARDEGETSSCYDECATAWPPVSANYSAGAGIDASLGSTLRTDGMEQLTVNGRPVYLFSGDSQAGDTNGQGLNQAWFVLGIDGEPIPREADLGY